ncbi:uncharacterized protein Z520_11062 [Fonsecaea multimorphosa CBS 102226]|uniref:SBDS family rRNA metabolism protein n=1 Tax=Fonsecaea multimorphosa CBS 102226 TaxID=1442371 RepID=A0A0D2K9Y7_9EURO|nr:uncharacterized protein Z520_11062 [Fonsecaea multimorphosa CBS 102226]KIX93208.1 hypothetical protein Z520_11062 [Fonsecaea multimorphosa CBS 102226]OAL18444.1 hypothetical protein AYO22_10640 [Fonsecaea multimorphosa]
MPIQQPANQIKLTNVSLVRYKKGKKRFELACYKNKLLEYRSGTETDLDNVLQVPTIFLNASKGETAPNAELIKAWPMPAQNEKQEAGSKGGGGKGGKKGKGKSTTDEGEDEKSWKDAIIEEILKRGEIQVNANERKELLDRMEREIVEEVAQRLVDPQTKRVYTTGMIKKGLDVLSKQGGHVPSQDSLGHKLGKLNLGEGVKKGAAAPKGSSETSGQATPMTDDDNESASGGNSKGKKSDMPTWTGVVTNKSVKQQALEAIRALIAWQPIPVMRARMRLRITCPTNIAKQAAKSKVSSADASEDAGADQGKGTIKDRILSFVEQVESQEVLGEEWEVVGFVEPGAFKALGEFIAAEMKGRGRLEVLDMAVTHTDD